MGRARYQLSPGLGGWGPERGEGGGVGRGGVRKARGAMDWVGKRCDRVTISVTSLAMTRVHQLYVD